MYISHIKLFLSFAALQYGQMKGLCGRFMDTQARMAQKVQDALQEREDMRRQMDEALRTKEAVRNAFLLFIIKVMSGLQTSASSSIGVQMDPCLQTVQKLVCYHWSEIFIHLIGRQWLDFSVKMESMLTIAFITCIAYKTILLYLKIVSVTVPL